MDKISRLFRRSKRVTDPVNVVRSQRGVAILLAMFAMMLMSYIAWEVGQDTAIDYVVARQQVNRIQAYYAAKAGVELSLLRIMLYKQAVAGLGDTLGQNVSMLDPIWSFPFAWPPTAMNGPGMTEADKSMMGDVVAESLMKQSQYAVTITPEGGLIDINDLGSDIKTLKQNMITQVVKIFLAEVQQNEDFADKYSGTRWEEVVNNIADYIDEDTQSLNGGDEGAPYRDIGDPLVQMPPNRPLRTKDELLMIAGVTDDFYNVLAPRITVFGTKGINVNYAPKEVLMALDPSMTEEAVNKALARRSNPREGGPFKDERDFFGFIGGFGVNTRAIQESKVPLLFDMEFNFRIVSTGVAQNVKREITAITYDYANLAQRLADLLTKQDQDQNPGGTPPPGTPPGTPPPGTPPGTPPAPGTADPNHQKRKIRANKGRPNVVYWEET